MKRYLIISICLGLALLNLLGCGKMEGTAHEHPRFTITLPDEWERVDTDGAVCFAPYGEPTESSNIVFYVTEKSYYFSEFTQEDYAKYVKQFTGYDTLTDVTLTNARISGWRAHRVVFSTRLHGAPAQIVLYAIDADQTFFFILLDVDGSTEMFDAAMKSAKLFRQ